MFIGLYAVAIAVATSLLAGTVSALRHGRMIDSAATSMAVLGISMPDFWLSYVLVYALALGAGIFPSYGFVSPGVSIAGAFYSGFLPALAVAAPMAAAFTAHPAHRADRDPLPGPCAASPARSATAGPSSSCITCFAMR